MARRLIDIHSRSAPSNSRARAATLACDDLYRELSRWVGPEGCHALFARALADARGEYAELGEIQLRARSEPYVEGVAESITAHGDAATADALEAMLVGLAGLLCRLIGEDTATKLIEQGLLAAERGNATSGEMREEA
jgi:hypothetical protein